MSKQFYMYLMPADVESLIAILKSQMRVLIIQSWSPGAVPVKLESALRKDNLMLKEGSVRADCYITPSEGAEIRMLSIRSLERWAVQPESEAIEFQGCEFDGNVLTRGRFYVQTDILVEGMIIPKNREFLIWADKVFRLAKKSLSRSKDLDAYVGEHAAKWKEAGGRFVSMVNPAHETV